MEDDLREGIPDWLQSLREPPSEGAPAPSGLPGEGPAPLTPPEAMLDDLREQALEADLEEVRAPPREGLAGMLQGLAPWQRFVLALLLFLDVALLGCMCLVMTGRVVPFP
ncbi:MAG TPA: hypothetical protein EYH30_07380 [Anaerolineales bacterium]|nr:hypothetical protein [Anaerolineae bacterium]HIQ01938.1 hypothetical protein [Anaerolineales bacterium]